MASRKVDFALNVISEATALAQTVDRLSSLAGVYVASGYAPAGADPITDEDLTGHDIDSAQLGEFAALVGALLTLVDDGVPATGDYRTVLAKIRHL